MESARRHSLAAVIAAALLLAGTPAQAQPAWQVQTHSMGNQGLVVDGELKPREQGGKRAYYLALVQALLQELGLPTTVEDVPLARGLKTVQLQPNAAFFNLNRTPEREKTVLWVGPISKEEDLLFEWEDRPSRIRGIDDARHLPICVVNGNVHDRILSGLGFTKLTRNKSYVGCIHMLRLGRVQLIALAKEGVAQLAAAAQVAPPRLRSTGVQITRTVGFIALSPQTPKAEVQRWQDALDRLVESGRANELRNRYWP